MGGGFSTSSSAAASQTNDFYNQSGINFDSNPEGISTTGSSADAEATTSPRQTAGGNSPQSASSGNLDYGTSGSSPLLWIGIALGGIAVVIGLITLLRK